VRIGLAKKLVKQLVEVIIDDQNPGLFHRDTGDIHSHGLIHLF